MWPVSHTFPAAFSLVTHLADPVAGGIKAVPSWGPGFPPLQVFQSFVFQTVFQGAPGAETIQVLWDGKFI